jgi:hypothetical protein
MSLSSTLIGKISPINIAPGGEGDVLTVVNGKVEWRSSPFTTIAKLQDEVKSLKDRLSKLEPKPIVKYESPSFSAFYETVDVSGIRTFPEYGSAYDRIGKFEDCFIYRGNGIMITREHQYSFDVSCTAGENGKADVYLVMYTTSGHIRPNMGTIGNDTGEDLNHDICKKLYCKRGDIVHFEIVSMDHEFYATDVTFTITYDEC